MVLVYHKTIFLFFKRFLSYLRANSDICPCVAWPLVSKMDISTWIFGYLIQQQLCYRKGFLSSTSYTLPLCKFGVHFNPFWISGTLGDIIALLTLNLYALQWRVISSLISVLSVKQFINAYKLITFVSCKYFPII